jgi:hypothetical protein
MTIISQLITTTTSWLNYYTTNDYIFNRCREYNKTKYSGIKINRFGGYAIEDVSKIVVIVYRKICIPIRV